MTIMDNDLPFGTLPGKPSERWVGILEVQGIALYWRMGGMWIWNANQAIHYDTREELEAEMSASCPAGLRVVLAEGFERKKAGAKAFHNYVTEKK